MSAEDEIRFEAANYCAQMASEAFFRGDYVACTRWWIEAAGEAPSVTGKKACIANAIDMWALVGTEGARVH